jgi:hypothetical protein
MATVPEWRRGKSMPARGVRVADGGLGDPNSGVRALERGAPAGKSA